ncbi:hypothetical protein D1641_14435 [Colidextribacter sp. OB.20]|uniref:hypothetical protein n=1 Tax=Colidextribacter sp. OB.20 TaxID=2304568 RepID=UPI0013689414|nr:hypothetical protein [Colidextribacter sp. OB.20]NBI11195.1 hypothetical protein [Colidextribacter sp. OB.20]
MPWSKLKNIILVILVITNLCLLAQVALPAIQSRRLLDQTREQAIQFLQGRGVQLDEGTVPQSIDLSPQVAERDLAGEERAAAALLGSPVTAEARGGEVYRYFNERGSIQFHSDGACSAQLEPEQFPLGEDRAAGCLALLKRMGLTGDILEEEGDTLIFRQNWEGTPLFTQQVTLVCQGDGLAAIATGRQLLAAPQPDPTRRTVTVATALIDLLNGVGALGDVCNRVDAIEAGYVTSASLSGAALLTPVWRVTTDTGAYQLDAVTGGVSRVS